MSNIKIRGIVALPSILLIGSILVEIGVALILIAYFFGQSGLGVRLSEEALSAARAGISDAVMRIVRNKNIDYAVSGSPYTIAVGGRSAQITICRDAATIIANCDTPNPGKHEIISTGFAMNKTRRLRAITNINGVNGEVRVESIKEIEI